MENIKTQSTYVEPEVAVITYAEWIKIIRQEADKAGLHPVLCEDHKKLLGYEI